MDSDDPSQLKERIKALEKENEQLKQSYQLHKKIMDSLPLGIQVFDENGFSYELNPAQKELLGLPNMEEGIGQFNVLTDPYSKAMGADKKYEKVYKGETYDHEFEYDLGARENTWNTREDKRIFHETILPIKDEKGRVEFAVAVLEDKTEERKAEQALKESEERHRITLNSIGDAVISTDTDGNVVHMNPIAQELTGWDADQAKNQPFHEVLHIFNARTGEKAINPVNKVLETGAIQGLANHTKLKARNGSEYQIADSAAPIKDEQDNLFGVVTVFRDVTEEYKKNQQIKESKEFLDAVINSIQEGISVLNTDLTIRYVNPVMEKWFPNKMPVVGKKCYAAYHDLSKPCDTCPTLRSLKSKKTETNIHSITSEDNFFDEKWYEIFCYPIIDSDSGDVTGIVEFVRDITQRKEAENELKRHKDLLAKSQEIAHVGSWELDLSKNRLIWSDEVYRIFGLEPQEFEATYEAFLNRVHPDDRKAVSEAYGGSISDGRDHYEIEHRIVRKKNGEIRYVHERCDHIKDESGKVIKSIGMVQDITEQRQSEENFKKLFENAPIGIFRTNSKGEPLMLNGTMAHILGFETPEEVIEYYNDLATQLYVDPQKRKEFLQILRNKGWVENFEYKAKRKDGKHVWFSMTAKVSINNDDNSFVIDGFTSDITERKQVERELVIKNRISNTFVNTDYKNFYKAVLDIIREVFDSKYGYFGYINDDGDLVSESLTQDVWNECQIEGKSIVFPKDSWAGVWGESLKKRETIYKNGNLQLPEGHVQLTSAMAAPIMVNDQLIGQIALANKKNGYDERDKTLIQQLSAYIAPLLHSKLNEEQYKQDLLEAKEKAEENDRLKSAFLANMSHEIRTPMNGIMGFSQMLQEKDFPKEKRDKFLNIIYTRTNHLLNIINDLVDVSKIEANQLTLNPQGFCLNDVFKELHRVYYNELKIKEKANIQLKVNKAFDDINSLIYSDPNRFRQIMDNLLNNAIKFTNEGTIEFGYELQSDNNKLLFYVKDTGIGVPSDQQKNIFERFRQAQDTNSSEHEGTGLGLTISKNLVELMGGNMWLDSIEGEGSAFYFTLPYKTHQAVGKEEINEEVTDENEGESKTLLIIEDDPTSLEYMKELLEPSGFSIIACATGKEGYEAFLNNPEIDLILMDIKLPDTTGLELTRKIRASMHHNDVPIIVQTAYAMSEDAQKSLDAGCDDYISKPIDKKQLLAKMHKFF